MNIRITLSIISLLLSLNIFSQTTKRVLFLGNSYTNVNNLPQIIAAVALSTNDNLIFDGNTPGGFTLKGHSTDATSLAKIKVGNWDFVVLQDQSQLPSFPLAQVQADVFPYAQSLDNVINTYNPCAETIFYMTWGKKNGDASNCANWPPVCTYQGMDSLLHLRYRMMADANDAIVSPVGALWKYLRQNYPQIELYQSDESHPSIAGSYAAACSFYTTIFRKNPEFITENYSLSPTDAAIIRSAVKTIVYDHLLDWHVGEYDPIADFSFSTNSNPSVTFQNQSTNATSYEWSFGDGTSSTTLNPSHTYATNGNYTVTLISTHCEYADTIVKIVNTTTTSIENATSQSSIQLYPNPVSDQLIVSLEKIDRISVVNAIGQTFYPSFIVIGKNTFIDFSSFTTGIYFLVIESNGKSWTQKVIKE